MIQPDRRFLLATASTLLTLLIISITIQYILLFRFTVPYYDAWYREVPLAVSIYDGTFQLSDLFIFHNVHFVPVPMAISAANIALDSSWRIEREVFIGVMLLGTSYLMVLDIIRRRNPQILLVAMPVIALIMFSLRQHANFIWSFAALQWFSQLFFVVAVAWGLAVFSLKHWSAWLWITVMTLGGLSTSGLGLVLIVAFTLTLCISGIKWRYIGLWALSGIIAIVFYIRAIPASYASDFSIIERFRIIWTSFISVISSFFFPLPWQTPPLVYLVVFVTVILWLLWMTRFAITTEQLKPNLPWLFLCLHGLGSAALIVLGQAFLPWATAESRYASQVLPFWIGVVGLALSTLNPPGQRHESTNYLSWVSTAAIVVMVLLQIRVNWLAFTVDRKPGFTGYYNGIVAEQCLWSFFVSRGESCVNQYENIGMGAIRPMLVDIQSRQLTAFADYDGYNPATTHMPSVFQHDDKIIISGQTPLQHVVNLTYEDRFGHIQSVPPAQIFRIVDEDASTALMQHASHVAVSNTDADMEPLTEFVRLEERVWYLRGYDETDFDRAYLDLLEENFTPAPIAGGRFNTTVYEDITLFTRKPSPQIQFEELAAIDAWRLSTPYTISPCDPVVIEMLWYSLADLDTTYSLALLLVDEETGQPALRIQGAPGGYETQLWAKDTFYPATEQFAGTCGLEPDTSLLLLMGLYPAGDPDAIPATYPDGTPIGDLVYLTTLRVAD